MKALIFPHNISPQLGYLEFGILFFVTFMPIVANS